MKFINNSIDSECLEECITEVDLEKQMANCAATNGMLIGHNTDRINLPDKNNMEEAKKITLTNGVSDSPAKCNGKVNGFYSEDDDFNLELEDSSEEGNSPSKKINDDIPSAPQIAQEIEDLLGINSNGIQEELNNLDGTESIEDNLDCLDDVEECSQELEEEVEEKDKESKAGDDLKIKNQDDIEKSAEDTKETDKCKTSSQIDTVLDEVEMENGDSITPTIITYSETTECTVNSNTKTIEHQEKESNASETVHTSNQENNEDGCIDSVADNSDEIPLTQSSTLSDNSAEWMVLDSVEASDDENKEKESIKDKSAVIIPQTDNQNTKEVVLGEDILVATEKEPSSETDCCAKAAGDGRPVEQLNEVSEKPEITSTTPLPLCEGEKTRKRSASVEGENIDTKKPKIEEPNCLVDSSSPVLKRPLTLTTENESKRTKLHETSNESTPLKNEKNQEDQNVSCDKNKEDAVVSLENTSKTNLCAEYSTKESPLNHSNEKVVSHHSTDNISSNGSDKEDMILCKTDDGKIQEKLTAADCEEKSYQPMNSSLSSKSSMETGKETPEEENYLIESVEEESSIPLKSSSEAHNNSKIINSVKLEENEENKENVSSCSVGNLKDLEKVKSESSPTDIKPEPVKSEPELEPELSRNEIASALRKLMEKMTSPATQEPVKKEETEQVPVTTLTHTEPKKMTNLDFSIERVVEKVRIQVEKKVPILKKFHKDQLRKLKRSELEEIIVSKICEAVAYKSEIGQMRQRTQALEETNEMWRKKVHQIEKQNHELEMVLKRFLNEVAHIKRENQNKVPVPVKVTRSVGLQVVLASSMQGALVSSRSKQNTVNENTNTQQSQESSRSKQLDRESLKDQVKSSSFTPPTQSSCLSKGKVRYPKAQAQTLRPSTPQTLPPKVTPPSTPVKTTSSPPIKTIQTPTKDLEVIDLTDKEEKAKASLSPVGGSIRVAPSTQVCFVQQTTTPSSQKQPLYLVQQAGQRTQFVVAASTASPQPGNSLSRPPPALAVPMFRNGNHLMTIQSSPQVNVKPTTVNPSPTTVARAPPGLRLTQQVAKQPQHPAPLPPTPATYCKPNMKQPPPKPQLKIAKTANGIMLSWSMSLSKDIADMQSYQLYAYQEGNQAPSTGLWKKVGDVKALPLPMACTLTQFVEGHKYHFAVRAVDTYGRIGPFSSPSSILLTK